MLLNMYQCKLRIYQGVHEGKYYIIYYNMIAQNFYKKTTKSQKLKLVLTIIVVSQSAKGYDT